MGEGTVAGCRAAIQDSTTMHGMVGEHRAGLGIDRALNEAH
jgi:hypothetical protein